MKDWKAAKEPFDRFLNWLHLNREEAAQQYERVRRRLIVFFESRGCADAEGLADETINRVMRKLEELNYDYTGDPIHIFLGVARFIYLEYLSRQVKRDGGAVPDTAYESRTAEESAAKEQQSQCLDECMSELTPEDRALALQYYRENKQAKIDHRKWLAQQLGLSPSTLRTRMNRLRQQLRECITGCAKKKMRRFA